MLAVVHERYGSPDGLQVKDLPIPTIGDDGILVRVRAASLNAADWHRMRGTPYFARLMTASGFGLRRPDRIVAGTDAAGVVAAVGRNVSGLKPGDEVFGAVEGSVAELARGSEARLALKPAGLGFEEAAAIPTAGTTALLAVREHGGLQPGQEVLVNGAGGGVGTFAVQIARALGGQVTAATSRDKLELVRQIGASEAIDRGREDVARRRGAFDLIVDCSGDRSLAAWRAALRPEGTLVMVGFGPGASKFGIGVLVSLVTLPLQSRRGKQRLVSFVATHSAASLASLKELAEAGKLRPAIDRVYPIRETPEAMRRIESGAAAGKVVISIG